ncbi:MAG: SelB C-terminal domain-containing protein, partial [Anaerolineales bacterium]
NMLAGVEGIDAFMLIIAADEGVMPQTREHLAILDLMGVQCGAVVLTKIDAAESDDWVGLVELDALDLLAGTPFEDAPIVRVSAHTGAGLDTLHATLDDLLAGAPPRPNTGRPVLPIDRVFTMSGFGTVVTGTLSGGELHVGQHIILQPGGQEARIRGLQSHNLELETVTPGRRVAVNLSGVAKRDVQRGDVLTLPGLLKPTRLADVTIRCLPRASRPLRHQDEVKVFIGPSATLAKIRLLDADSLAPGEMGYGQLQLRDPAPFIENQRFVLRFPSPPETLGGGTVLDTAPGRKWKRGQPDVLQRFEMLATGDAVDHLAFHLKQAQFPQPQTTYDDALLQAARQRYGLIDFEDRVVHPDGLAMLATAAQHILEPFHAAHPLLGGMASDEFLRQLRAPQDDESILALLAAENIIEWGKVVRLPGRGLQFSKAQQRAVDALLAHFDAEPYQPPSWKDALAQVGDENILHALQLQDELVFIKPDVLLRPGAYRELLAYARDILAQDAMLTVRDLRDHFQTTRRIALPFLDHLEAHGITRRDDDGHRLKNPAWERLGL